MFDVSWSMEQETVRSHRTKKATNPKPPTSTKPPSRTSLMSSASSGSSMKAPSTSSRGMSALGLFKRDKKQNRKGKEVDRGDAASIASSQPSTTATTTTEGSEEGDSEDEDEEPRGRVQGPTSYPREGTVIDDSCQSSILSSADSISSTFSPWSTASSAYSHPLDITAKHEFQPINRHSFVMRTTEVTTTSKGVAARQAPLQEVHISSDVPNHYLDSDSCTETSPQPKSLRDKLTKPSSSRTTSGRSRPNTARLRTPQPISPVTQNWQPPDNWACPRPGSPMSIAPSAATRQVQKSTHLSHQIKRMASASAKIMLERLTEEWTQVSDADFYKDLMFEKQLWTLTALAFLKRSGQPYVAPEMDSDSESEGDSRGIRVLSLFESKASFTFNLTFSAPPALPLHHPIPATAALPFPAELFDQITSLPLPTLLPSTDIPRLLRECIRILLPGGTLKLMLLDATPVVGTMGTLLKSWLAKHLCGSLEKRGRLIEVRKRMAIYLLDAGFIGSECDLKISFRAAQEEFSKPKVPKVDKNGKDKHGNMVSSKDVAKAERELEKAKKEETMHRLSVVVGRLLWKELWGPYVLGHKWWWEDERIVEECRGLGTRWEGVVVEAVKRT